MNVGDLRQVIFTEERFVYDQDEKLTFISFFKDELILLLERLRYFRNSTYKDPVLVWIFLKDGQIFMDYETQIILGTCAFSAPSAPSPQENGDTN